MNKKLVSIVIPTYKRAEMLDRAINSCLNQTYKEIEIIVVDDNNPNSEERASTSLKMKKYKDNKKIKYIKNKKNMGGAESRNVGIKNSCGEYIAFLDDDDYFYEEKIQKQLDFMLKNNLDASFTGSDTYDETRNKLVKSKRYKNYGEYDNILKFHLVEMIVSTQTFMYKKSVLENIGYFTNVPAGQEYYLMYKTIINKYKVSYLDEILTRICIHSGERITTSKKKLESEKFLYNLKKQHFDILNFSQKRQIKYIYKYNIWTKYKNSGSYKKYIWLFYILISHPIIIIKKFIR